MGYKKLVIDEIENCGSEAITHDSQLRLFPFAKAYQSVFLGPALLNRYTTIGPDVEAGKYLVVSDYSSILRTTIGNFCTMGMRSVINPFNHPTTWLSIHEFQYHARAFDFYEEYRDFKRLPREAAEPKRSQVGSDVWLGHNVNVLSGVNIGSGAIIGAGAVVTKDVPSYAIVAGVPAQIRGYRYSEKIIERLLQLKWWDLEMKDLSGLPFNQFDLCLEKLEEIRFKKAQV